MTKQLSITYNCMFAVINQSFKMVQQLQLLLKHQSLYVFLYYLFKCSYS